MAFWEGCQVAQILSIFVWVLYSAWHDDSVFNFAVRTTEENALDNVTLIRVVAGVLAVVVFLILVFRMRKKAPR